MSVPANPLSIFSLGSSHERRVVGYIVREHRAGRALADILEDDYVCRQLTYGRRRLLLERPRLIHALVDDVAAGILH